MADRDDEVLLQKGALKSVPWKKAGLVIVSAVGLCVLAGGLYFVYLYQRGMAYLKDMQKEKVSALSLNGKELEWYRINDVVMGGRSSSVLSIREGGSVSFTGEISIIGGGFTSFTSQDQTLDLPASVTGIRVKAITDGQLYKLTIRTDDVMKMSEASWACDFPEQTLEAGKETTFVLPLSKFLASRRGKPVDAGVLDATKIRSVGINLSYLDMHGNSNPHFGPGGDATSWPFEFQLVDIAAVEGETR